MKKLALLMAVAILSLTSPMSGKTADKIWKLGERVVPGPLPPVIGSKVEVDSQIDLVYGKAGDFELKFDFAKPKLCKGQKVPLAVYIHGGAWTSGDKGAGVSAGIKSPEANLFYQLGFAVAAINYRLCPKYIFPAQVEDCKLAIRFFRSNADNLGIDPDRIGIWGGSAGGHLVSMLGCADKTAGLEGPELANVSSRVQAVVDYFGPTDIKNLMDNNKNKNNPGITTIANFLGCNPYECPEKAIQASPVTYVSKDDPPILMVHGDRDVVVPYSQSTVFAKKLHENGNACALIKVKNGGHGFVPTPKTAKIAPDNNSIRMLTVSHIARYLEPAVFGDANLDGQIDLTDAIEVAVRTGQLGTDAMGNPAPDSWNPLCDLVPDGKIDDADWKAFLQVWTR
jgi:acetyl esterase/lipase